MIKMQCNSFSHLCLITAISIILTLFGIGSGGRCLNQSWTVKMYKQILLRTVAIEEKGPQHRTGLNSKYTIEKLRLIAQSKGFLHGLRWV